MVIGGAGLTCIASIPLFEPMRAGLLKRLLPEWQFDAKPIYAVFPNARAITPKTAALMELVYFAGRRQGWRVGRVSVVAGGIAGALIGLSLPIQGDLLYKGASLPPVWWLGTTAVLSGVFGLLGGFAGWRFGGMLCLLAPAKKGETADA